VVVSFWAWVDLPDLSSPSKTMNRPRYFCIFKLYEII
jgi:hypothetical protein